MEIRSVGAFLKETREAKGITFHDAQQHTKIGSYYLQAIEDEEFEKLPAPAYAKGFLKLYADYLGVDREWVISQYLKDHVGESKQVLVLEGETLEKESILKKIKALDPRITAGIAVGVIVLVILFRFLFHTSVNSIMKGELSKDQGWNPGSQLIKPAGIKTVVQKPVQGKIEKLVLEGVALEDVWIRVHADGKLIFEQILKKGDREIWYAERELKVRLGNSDNVSLIFNGEATKNLSPTGKVLNVRFTKKGWWVSE